MVTRAIIKKIISEKEVQVEVPMFGLIEEGHGEEQVNELPIARISTTPGCSPNFKENDVVLICIEDNDLNNPMIMGRLIPDNKSIGTSNAVFDTFKVNKDTTLSRNTTIGKVSADSLSCVEGISRQILQQLALNIKVSPLRIFWLYKRFKEVILVVDMQFFE